MRIDVQLVWLYAMQAAEDAVRQVGSGVSLGVLGERKGNGAGIRARAPPFEATLTFSYRDPTLVMTDCNSV